MLNNKLTISKQFILHCVFYKTVLLLIFCFWFHLAGAWSNGCACATCTNPACRTKCETDCKACCRCCVYFDLRFGKRSSDEFPIEDQAYQQTSISDIDRLRRILEFDLNQLKFEYGLKNYVRKRIGRAADEEPSDLQPESISDISNNYHVNDEPSNNVLKPFLHVSIMQNKTYLTY